MRDLGLSLGDAPVAGENVEFMVGGGVALLGGGAGKSGNVGATGAGWRHFREV